MTDPDLEIMRLPLDDATCPDGGYMIRPYKGQKKAWRYLCDETDRFHEIYSGAPRTQNKSDETGETGETGKPRQIVVDGSTLQKQSGTGLLPGEYLNSRVIQCGEDSNYPEGGVIVEGQLGRTNFVVTNPCPGCVRSETAVPAEKKILGGLPMRGTPMTVNGKAYMKYQNAKGIIMQCLDVGPADPPGRDDRTGEYRDYRTREYRTREYRGR